MQSGSDLARILDGIDGRGYKAYKDIQGGYALGDGVELHVDHVQGDPFAAPSRVRVRIAMDRAALPPALVATRVRQIALRDALARELHDRLRREPGTAAGSAGSGKSGLVAIDVGGQQVLERSAVALAPDGVEARLEVGLPASGRRVRGRAAERLLLDLIPTVVEDALCWETTDGDRVTALVACIEQQERIREQLEGLGLVAFVGNGARLPRRSGASDRPMLASECIPFASPTSLEVEIDGVRGMGIPQGVTLIVGGGYHGKSTLLRALERGVYPHVPGDGRELVVSAPGLVKVRAEDGRFVEGVDIHGFVRALPGAAGDTRSFSSADASGSTSQAASIVEALEAGATGILLDEDTSATNFMVRDARMQALVAREAEPITPFVDRVRELWERLGTSTVLVMGGCGDYFDAADTVIRMRDYAADDATAQARAVAASHPSERTPDAVEPLELPSPRIPLPESFDASRGRREVRIAAKGREALEYGELQVDLRALEQLVETSQTRAVGLAIHWIAARAAAQPCPLPELLDELDVFLDREGLDPLDPHHRPGRHPGNLARPRRYEVAAAIGRMRSLCVRSGGGGPDTSAR